jgi:RNA polymerase sigma factor (sigma-70 family)
MLRDAKTSARTVAAFAATGDSLAMAMPVPDGFAAASAAERAGLLRQALGRLDARRREVLILRWGSGLRLKEIAAVLGISVRAVENLHIRAMADLRELLAGRFP